MSIVDVAKKKQDKEITTNKSVQMIGVMCATVVIAGSFI